LLSQKIAHSRGNFCGASFRGHPCNAPTWRSRNFGDSSISTFAFFAFSIAVTIPRAVCEHRRKSELKTFRIVMKLLLLLLSLLPSSSFSFSSHFPLSEQLLCIFSDDDDDDGDDNSVSPNLCIWKFPSSFTSVSNCPWMMPNALWLVRACRIKRTRTTTTLASLFISSPRERENERENERERTRTRE
jgi:hypothetical protein